MYSDEYSILLAQISFQLSLDLPTMIGLIAAVVVLVFLMLLVVIKIKNKTQVKTELSVSNKYPFQPSDLVDYLGGKDNVKEAIGSYSKIKFMLNDTSLIKSDDLKKLSTGIIEQSTSVTIIFGNISKPLSEDINKLVN